MSALLGDNVFKHSTNMPWYQGLTFMSYLEEVNADTVHDQEPFRMPVQWVNRPHQDFRGFSGTIAGGTVRVGDEIVVLPAGTRAIVQNIVEYKNERTQAERGEAITLVLDREVDVSRGNVISSVVTPASISDRVEAHVIWMHEQPVQAGKQMLCKLGTALIPAVITKIASKIDVNTMETLQTDTLAMNEIGVCVIQFESKIGHDTYLANRDMGGFIFIDRLSNETIAAGMIIRDASTTQNITWHKMDVDTTARALIKGQKPCVLWLTGLSGSGKSTIANLIERALWAEGKHTYILDGDNVRHGLSSDLGFKAEDRIENIRRVAEVSRLMIDAGLIIIVSLISPFQSERDRARRTIKHDEFVEVYIDTPLEECERRDPKGLYKRARAGEIRGMTGLDAPYEAPENPELHVSTMQQSPEDSALIIVSWLREHGYLQT
jgi:bifunctional enzyme CysN/CysC